LSSIYAGTNWMKVKFLDKGLKKFLSVSGILLVGLIILLLVFGLIYRYSTIHIYNFILILLIIMTLLIILFYISSILGIIYIYKHKRGSKIIKSISGSGIKTLLPISMIFADVFNVKKDFIRKFYVDFNNILVNTQSSKYRPENVLVLIPHCLQYSECKFKITNNTDNCKRCGRCTIGDILEVAKDKGVEVKIVTGGTAARNIVKSLRPRLIFAVACERDLTSGIVDVGKIPVIGLINERPNGPCYNTTINIDTFKKRLDDVLKI